MRSAVQALSSCCWVAASACVGAPPPPPVGGSGVTNATSVAGTQTDSTAETLGSSTDGLDATSTGGEPTSTTGPAGEPLLLLSNVPAYDFGDVDLGGEVSHDFTVSNQGTGTAFGVTGRPLDPPFDYAGGFPGADGTCGPQLAAGEACTVVVRFTPTSLGPFAGTLAIGYEGHPDVLRALAGGGSGESGNLLVNGGGEDVGSPPPGWAAVQGSWSAGSMPSAPQPFAGSSMIHAVTGPDGVNLLLHQDVAVDAWSATIDQDLMRFSFDGHARSHSVGDDEHRIRLHYLDAAGRTLQVWTTGFEAVGSWTQYSDVRTVPAGTRVIRAELGCSRIVDLACNAYFDGLELRALYP